ncbi:hypothetical protein [Altericista sp. CCNU0014]|uniref:hypothetical protein n=1 Tax=Altericista sp. CCNU0014 TaxID=3082949 RepID=UPI00384BBA5D
MKFDLHEILPLNFFRNKTSLADVKSRAIRSFKIHTYFEVDNGKEFFLEPRKDSFGLYTMTSQGFNVKPNDRILIQDRTKRRFFEICEIQYYNDLSDVWIARLIALTA